MFSYRIIPIDSSHVPIDMIAHDAAGVIGIVSRSSCKEADVERDGVYSFSLELSDHGVWRIFKRSVEVARAAAPKEAGAGFA